MAIETGDATKLRDKLKTRIMLHSTKLDNVRDRTPLHVQLPSNACYMMNRRSSFSFVDFNSDTFVVNVTNILNIGVITVARQYT